LNRAYITRPPKSSDLAENVCVVGGSASSIDSGLFKIVRFTLCSKILVGNKIGFGTGSRAFGAAVRYRSTPTLILRAMFIVLFRSELN
jgi:hypothetical protein